MDDFLVQLGKQLENPAYRELVGITDPMEVFFEYVSIMDGGHLYQETARPKCSPKKGN